MLNDNDPQYWFVIAEHDIVTVQLLIKEKGYADIIIYHCHQAVEKLLKGLIIKEKQKAPFIHDLIRLYQMLMSINFKYQGLEDEIANLHSFYYGLRYPQSELLDQQELNIAHEAYKIVIKRLIDYK